MWHTQRLIGENWTRVAPWGNVDNAIDSASFLADTCKVRTRVVDSLSLVVVWDSVEGATDQAQGAEGAEGAEAPVQARELYTLDGFKVITAEGAQDIPMGLFAYSVARNNPEGEGTHAVWYTSADFTDRRTYSAGPYRTEEEACAEVRRVSATYPNLPWFLIR